VAANGSTDAPKMVGPWRVLISFRNNRRQGPVSGVASQEQLQGNA
jgi:hypothetical protein